MARETRRTRALLLSASDEERRSFAAALEHADVALASVCDLAAGIEATRQGSFDVVIVSHPLPDADVIASCARLREVPGGPPLVLLDSLDPNQQTFPMAIRPAQLLQKPVDTGKLVEAVRAAAEAADPYVAPASPPLAFAADLLRLAEAHETGVLEVSCNGVHTRIFLHSGAAVSAEGGSLRETLGRMLLRRGALADADYVRVIERMTERVMANEHQRMGEVLVELGLLSSQEVHEALAAQVLEKVIACFQGDPLTWSFCELDALPEGLSPFAMPPMERLVYLGLRERAAPEALAAGLAPHAGACPRLARPAAVLQEVLQLDAIAMRQLERVDGTHALGALAREDRGLAALLATLLLIDAVALGSGPRAPAVPREAKRVPFARVVVGRRGNTAVPAAAPAPTTAVDAARTRLEAEQCFRQAQQRLAADQLGEASRLARRAVALEPGEVEFTTLEAWVAYLEARQALRVARARATTAAHKLAAADPKAPHLHTMLGRLALDEGERERAIREFELALLHDPEDAEASRALKHLRG